MCESTERTPRRGRWGPAEVKRWVWRLGLVAAAPFVLGLVVIPAIYLALTVLILVESPFLQEFDFLSVLDATRYWLIFSIAWLFFALLAPLAWVMHRVFRYHEDMTWWWPPFAQRTACLGLFAGFVGFGFIAICWFYFGRGQNAIAETVKDFWLTAFLIILLIRTTLLSRKLRSMHEPHCWSCFYNVSHSHPDSDACPECGFSVSESISRWRVCPKRFRPKWVTESVEQKEPPTDQSGTGRLWSGKGTAEKE